MSHRFTRIVKICAETTQRMPNWPHHHYLDPDSPPMPTPSVPPTVTPFSWSSCSSEGLLFGTPSFLLVGWMAYRPLHTKQRHLKNVRFKYHDKHALSTPKTRSTKTSLGTISTSPKVVTACVRGSNRKNSQPAATRPDNVWFYSPQTWGSAVVDPPHLPQYTRHLRKFC